MKVNLKVFLVAFVFSFIVNIPSYASTLLIRTLNPGMWNLIFFSTNVISFILSPLLLFVSFYLIGRNIELASDFPSVLVSLFIGSWVGQLIGGLLIFWCVSIALFASTSYILLQCLWGVFSFAFSFEFFVGFTALAMAYIVKKRAR
jgi:hypothetical protein